MEAKSRYAFGHAFVDVYYGVNVNFHVYLNGQSQQLREPFLFTGIFQPELVLKFKFLRVLLFCNRQHKEYIHISQNWHVLQWISTHLNPSDKCSLEDVSRCFLSIERLPSLASWYVLTLIGHMAILNIQQNVFAKKKNIEKWRSNYVRSPRYVQLPTPPQDDTPVKFQLSWDNSFIKQDILHYRLICVC